MSFLSLFDSREVNPAMVFQEDQPKEKWWVGLPRTTNPKTGRDDTEAILHQCEDAYPERPYNTLEQVNQLRRGLYEGIVYLRGSGGRGYLLDAPVERRYDGGRVLQ